MHGRARTVEPADRPRSGSGHSHNRVYGTTQGPLTTQPDRPGNRRALPLKGTLARLANSAGVQRIVIRAARSCGPVIIPSAPETGETARGRLPSAGKYAEAL